MNFSIPRGQEFASMDVLRPEVMANARGVMSGDLLFKGVVDLRFRIDAENAGRMLVHTLRFADGVNVIPEAA